MRGNRFIGYDIAYSLDDNDLSTEDDTGREAVGASNNRKSFIPNYEPGDDYEKKEYETLKMQTIAHGPYLCPRCKAMKLMLYRVGNWD